MKVMGIREFSMATILAWPIALSAQSADDIGIEGKMLGETIFKSMDTSDLGEIHLGEIEEFRDSVFAGMDYDQNGKVTYEEFSSWDLGFRFVAEEVGRAEAYTTASKIVFAFWDRDGDRELTETEMRFAMSSDFRRADLDDDGLLTQNEFISGFPVIVAMRAAIRPDL